MSPSGYLRAILEREAVADGTDAALRLLEEQVEALVSPWAGRHLLEVYPSGSFEKRTANLSSTNIDFVVSLSPTTPFTLPVIYESLFTALEREGLEPVRRYVSIGVEIEGAHVDIIPAKRESLGNDMHEIYSVPRRTTMKTNLGHHVHDVRESGRLEEIRILKLWRDQFDLTFPSFYLELSALAALRRRPIGDLADNVWVVFGYLSQLFVARAILDPANATNIVSDQLTKPEKEAIRDAAADTRRGRAWSQIVS